VCCQADNTGLFDACKKAKVSWIVLGGDASNDFKGTLEGINMVQAVKSGFGGNTGDLLKAARIFKVQMATNGQYTTTTWTRD